MKIHHKGADATLCSNSTGSKNLQPERSLAQEPPF